jgi:hypothetical protein
MLRTIRVRNINANKYATEESNMTVLKPADSAIATVSTGASMEKQALTAQAQGMREVYLWPSSPMPVGKGIPIKKPTGNRERDKNSIFVRRRADIRWSSMTG